MSNVLNRADNALGSRSPLPTDTYTVRCIKVEGKFNDKWSCEQTNTTWEIVAPESIEVDGKTERIAGRKFPVCFMHTQAEEWGQGRIVAFGDRLGLDESTVDDIDEFRAWLKDKPSLEWMLSSEEDVKRYPKNHANRELAGKEMLTASGQKISNGYRVKADINDAVAVV